MFNYVKIFVLIILSQVLSSCISFNGKPSSEYTSYKKGDKFKSISEVQVNVLTQWFAPFTGGNEAVLPRNEILIILHDAPEQASAASLRPVRYEELHSKLVPKEDREAEKYSSYYIVISFSELQSKFERVK